MELFNDILHEKEQPLAFLVYFIIHQIICFLSLIVGLIVGVSLLIYTHRNSIERTLFALLIASGALIIAAWLYGVRATLQLHKAMKAGELIRADCPFGYLQAETGQHYLAKEWAASNFQANLVTAEKALKLASTIFLVTFFFPIIIYWCLAKGADSKLVVAVAVLLVTTILMMFGMFGKGESPTALLYGGLASFIVVLAVIKRHFLPQFTDGLLSSTGFAFIMLTLFILLAAWIVLRNLSGLSNTQSNYAKQLEKTHRHAGAIDDSFLHAYVGNNYLLLNSAQKGNEDQSYTEQMIADILSEKAVDKDFNISSIYFKHRDGREFEEIRQLASQQSVSLIGPDDTAELNKEKTQVDDEKLAELRTDMADLRKMNDKTVAEMSKNTNIAIGMLVPVAACSMWVVLSFFT